MLVKSKSGSTVTILFADSNGLNKVCTQGFQIGTTWQQISFTFTPLVKGNAPELQINPNNIGEFWITQPQLEISNKASTYSPATEDVQKSINDAKKEASNAQTSADQAKTNVSNLNSYVDGAFKDGVIDNAEAKAIEK